MSDGDKTAAVTDRMCRIVMDRASHLSVILDLCPTQWLLSAQPSNPHPLSFDTFLSHLLVFLNSHVACKHENSLAVFGALPGKRSVLSSLSIFSQAQAI